MARISEIHFANAHANATGVGEFVEIALGNGEDPADFQFSTYNQNGTVHVDIPLTHPDVVVSTDPENGETIYTIFGSDFNYLITDPDSNSNTNNEAVALTDVSGSTNTVIDFYDWGGGTQNIVAVDGAAAGATSENLASNFQSSIQFNQPDPDTPVLEGTTPGDTGPACFVEGTLIDTDDGPVPVEELRAGDLVATLDNGFQPIRWVGSDTTDGSGPDAPIVIRKGTLGAERDVAVSPQHRVLISGWQSELLYGEAQILVPAKALINGNTVVQAPRPQVRYFHILLDGHEILLSSGVASESFYPGQVGQAALAACDEAIRLIPELSAIAPRAKLARFCASVCEGRILSATSSR